MVARTVPSAILACAVALASAGEAARAASFQRNGTYVYKTADFILGTETFSTIDIPGGHEIRSRTDLDLGGSLIGQSSILRVNDDGTLRSVRLAGSLGGKPVGLQVDAWEGMLWIRDTLTGAEQPAFVEEPVQWITGNFMQHVIYAFSRYDRAAGGLQEVTTQAGPLQIDPRGPARLHGPESEVAVQHYSLALLEEELELYVDAAGFTDLIVINGQDVRIYRHGFEDWTEGPMAP